MKILAVEDDKKLGGFLRKGLEARGFVVDFTDNGDEGYILATTRSYDAIVLDIMLPGRDGLSILRNLRDRLSAVPVILLTARSALNERLDGLNLGADDYLTKPFGPAELLARVRAHLRRRSRPEGATSSVHEFGDIHVDLSRRSVERNGKPIHLTPIEYRLLSSLLAAPGSVLTHRHLLNAVWGPSHLEDNHYVRVHMASLRKKMELDPAQPKHLVTEAGIGYRFVT